MNRWARGTAIFRSCSRSASIAHLRQIYPPTLQAVAQALNNRPPRGGATTAWWGPAPCELVAKMFGVMFLARQTRNLVLSGAGHARCLVSSFASTFSNLASMRSTADEIAFSIRSNPILDGGGWHEALSHVQFVALQPLLGNAELANLTSVAEVRRPSRPRSSKITLIASLSLLTLWRLALLPLK